MLRIKAALVVAAFAAVLMGDQPPAKPEKKTFRSPKGKFLAVSDPASKATFVFSADNIQKPLWTIPGWHEVVYVSDDGAVIVGYPGNNLLPKDYRPTDSLLSFYQHGKLVKVIAVKDLIDAKDLRPTASHYSWGSFLGFDKGKFLLELNNGRRLAFVPRTGEQVKP